MARLDVRRGLASSLWLSRLGTKRTSVAAGVGHVLVAFDRVTLVVQRRAWPSTAAPSSESK
jgi:hypothetical protein